MIKETIHFCHYSSQPYIYIACDDSCEMPAWDQPSDLGKDIYKRDDGIIYTFAQNLVNCKNCLIKYPKLLEKYKQMSDKQVQETVEAAKNGDWDKIRSILKELEIKTDE